MLKSGTRKLLAVNAHNKRYWPKSPNRKKQADQLRASRRRIGAKATRTKYMKHEVVGS